MVVHTGAARYFCDLIRRGYVDVLLAGNALAVHDIEGALYGTSLGVSLETGAPVEGATGITCAPSTRSGAPGASARRSRRAC